MDLKESLNKYKEKLPKSKSGFLVILGLIGMVLILISSLDIGKHQNGEKQESVEASVKSSQSYTENLEARLENVISDMLGGSKVNVLITLESSAEYIYADELKTDADVTKDQSALKTQESDSNHKTYVIVKDADGNEQPLIVTEKMPIIRGVVIVCENGQTSNVAQAVRLAVKSALNVDDSKICVIGRHI
ncbi:MAG: hypothetical protein IIX60_05275 [Clostridia bacterium]|nr:hypothetical protein [Clostridia bacterium]